MRSRALEEHRRGRIRMGRRPGPRWRVARGFLAGLTLAWLLPAPSVRALEFGEDFDRDWSQPGAATCHAGQEVFVRRVANDACGTDYGGAWEGGSAADHDAPWCASADTCGSLAVHRFSDFVPGTDGVGVANSGVLEIMTSARRQSSRQGRLQVDFHVHEDVPLSGAGEHYLNSPQSPADRSEL